MYTMSPRAAGVAAMPLHPAVITVPGDPSTPAGERYQATFGNDFRQEQKWSPAHELQILHLVATAKPVKLSYLAEGNKQRSRFVNVPTETIGVFLQTVPKEQATSQTFEDEQGLHFDVVTDDGRQRRLDCVVLNDRLKWIAREFVLTIWADESDAEKRRLTLRERLLAFGPDGADPAKVVKGASAASLPPLPPGGRNVEGAVLAPWLTTAFVEKLTGAVPWFNNDGDPIEVNLRCDVRGEDVDLGDVSVLVNNLRGKKASVETSMSVQAKQYQAMLSAKNADGTYRYTPTTLAKEFGTSASTIQHHLDYLNISDEVRDAVDRNHRGEGGISLKLAVTGRECVCFGYDKDGGRHLLSPKQQINIWGELLKAFAVEDSGDGIPDNTATRKVLRAIKERELASTKYAPSKAPERRESAGEKKAKEAAKRIGVDIDAPEPKRGAKPAVVADHAAPSSSRSGAAALPSSSSLKLRPRVDIRDKLRAKAASWRINLTSTEQDADDKRERALVIGTAAAVAAYYEGDDSLLCRFPALQEALDGRHASRSSSGATPVPATSSKSKPSSKSAKKSSKSSGRKLRAAYVLKPNSPFAEEQRVKEVVEAALTKWEEQGGDSDEDAATMHGQVEKLLATAATDVCGETSTPELLVKCVDKLTAAFKRYYTAPTQPDKAGHIREFLFGESL